jgi:hypothetical protein
MDSSSRSVLATALFCALSGLASGQSSTILIDETSGPFLIEQFQDMDVHDNGDWFARVDAFLPANDEFVLENGTPIHRDGDLVSLRGAALGEFEDLGQSLSCAQHPYLGLVTLVDDADVSTPPVIGQGTDRALVWGTQVLLREGDVTTAPEVAPGTVIGVMHRSCSNSNQDCLILTTMDDPTVTGFEAAVLFVDLDTSCSTPTVVAQHVVFRTGDRLGTGAKFATYGAKEKRSFDLNARGDWAFVGEFDTPIDRRIVMNDRGILTETQPIPGGLGAATSLQLATIDINDLGDYVIQTRTNAGTVLIKGNARAPSQQTKFIQADENVPDPDVGPFRLWRIGNSTRFANGAARNWAPAIMTNSGDVIWYGEWHEGTQEDPKVQQAIFINHKILVRKGHPQAGVMIDDIGTTDAELRYEIEASPNGRYLLFEAKAGDPLYLEALFRMDLGESVPFGVVTQGCTNAYPSPTLQHVTDDAVLGDPLGADGFPLVNNKDFFLTVTPPPTGATAIALIFSALPPPNYPCGSPIPCGPCGGPFQLLLGGTQAQYRAIHPLAQNVFSIRLGSPSLIGLVSYAQAFYAGPRGVYGATNGLRFVFGAP